MNSRAMTLSLVMAGIAVFFVMTSVSSIEESAKTKFGDEVTVLVAKSDIKEMDTVLDSMIEPKSVPKSFVEPAAIAFNAIVKQESTDYAMEIRRVIGNVAIVPIRKGEQLSLNKISEPSLRTGLAPQITPGKRAIAVPVDDNTSVSKLIKPGDRVDVIAIVDAGTAGGRDNKIAKTMLQDVVILAVGRNITNNLARKIEVDPATGKSRIRSLTEYDGYSSITLEVDPAQAQQLAVITSGSGNKLVFTLRNNDDTDRNVLGSSRAIDALNDQARMPASPTNNLTGPGGAR